MTDSEYEPDFEKVERWGDLQKKIRKFAPGGIFLIVLGLFLPWVSWESQGDIPAGSIAGLEILDGALDSWLFLFCGSVATYLCLRKKSFLSNLFVSFLGLIAFLGGSLDVSAPWGFAPQKLSQAWEIVDVGPGLYLEMFGGLLILGVGIALLFLGWLIKDETTPPPPY
ncbi:hypothetical protein AKJ41_05795 [candidate division MSBL1 archaeon SCGC-AAA259O05]|uniref:Uncharacterized protein n=1 Tax=candidate division MSBL1 archaeon SCGC-AAA259O05 TaxID=1698271 RepID=A0A133UYH8_9EURY|nr:hypothetical protein AKJ41_05795 [candidate division MSBL1 archaeon SCGC-AAA259O05]